jgi:biotin-dependent carboxylase-like uncharacterized protein
VTRTGRGIAVARVAGLATIQDGGRPGRMHEGIPPGGALVPDLLARANRAVGNAPDAPAIELFGSMTIVARGASLRVATEDGEGGTLGDGEEQKVEGRRGLRVRYVAIGGGIDVPWVLGGRGTLAVAGIGGVEGRGLRKGDWVGVGGGVEVEVEVRVGVGVEVGVDDSPIRVIAGPDHARFAPEALHALLEEPFTLSPESNRSGSRLFGPRLLRLDHDSSVSAPMVAGAIEVPASGDPIVLGPDHPTTGGYPVLAVVLRADLGRFHARPVGSVVRFTRAGGGVTTRV